MAARKSKNWTCPECHQKFRSGDRLAHQNTEHGKALYAQSLAPGSIAPGMEPADHQETTELPPGAREVRKS